MKIIDYLLEGFGFKGFLDFSVSTLGFITLKISGLSSFLALIATCVSETFGISLSFILAYVILISFEWLTGILASLKRKEKHQSRKLGRMIFKITVYSIPLYIFNVFSRETDFPTLKGFEIDPFSWLYWTVLIVIIWQLLVSLLENLKELEIEYADVLLKIINRKFYKQFDLLKKEDLSKKEKPFKKEDLSKKGRIK